MSHVEQHVPEPSDGRRGEASSPLSVGRRALILAALIVAGEAVFSLPFVVARVFRPPLLDALNVTNLQLGTAFSLYGVVAMLAYFPSGPLADRFSTRRLLAASLVATSLGGLYYATLPGFAGLCLLYAFWGGTTILLFWGALIRATREFGGAQTQGAAFGSLDGGRGLVAAVLASIGAVVFRLLLPDVNGEADPLQKQAAMRQVILIFTGITAATAALVWCCVPDRGGAAARPADPWPSIRAVLANPAVWLQGVIVVCAYASFKGIDNYGLYARDVFGMSDRQAAQVAAFCLWMRPFAALAAGLLADRIGGPRAIGICFITLAAGNAAVALGVLSPSLPWTLYAMVAGTGIAIFGLRGVYFAIFKEARVPLAFTGTAVGLVSVVGFTPEIFMGPLMGYLTDTYPGARGHHYFFAVLAGVAAFGLATTLLFQRLATRRAAPK